MPDTSLDQPSVAAALDALNDTIGTLNRAEIPNMPFLALQGGLLDADRAVRRTAAAIRRLHEAVPYTDRPGHYCRTCWATHTGTSPCWPCPTVMVLGAPYTSTTWEPEQPG